MRREQCPACFRWTYMCESGEYESDGQKISPDHSFCSKCGFTYDEDIRTSESEKAKEWRADLLSRNESKKKEVKDEKNELPEGVA